ncbi:MAG TPA: AI-2E family transporter [Silvibacterium sp.]|nr:AI-2E family transporter [Silvibacterium sp.]
MEFPERRTTSVLLTVLFFAAVCGIAYAARHVILLFVLSVFFAYLLNPAVEFLQHHSLFSKNLRGAAVTRVYIGILILIALAAYTFAPAVVRRTARAVDQVPIVLDGLSTGEIATEIGDKYGWSDEQKTRLRTVLLRHKGNFRGLQDWIDRSLSQAAQIAGWMALIPILAIFFLRDGNQIVETAIQMLLPQRRREPARMLASQIHAMLTNYIRAQVLLCLFSLAFYTAVLLLFRFPYAMALSVLGATLEFIPVIGWMSTAAVIVAVGLANDLHWAWVAALLLLWRVAQDYFNLPRALGHRLEIHPLTVIFAVLAGAEVGGIVGIYLAVPLVASLALIWRMRSRQPETPEVKEAEPELPSTLVR